MASLKCCSNKYWEMEALVFCSNTQSHPWHLSLFVYPVSSPRDTSCAHGDRKQRQKHGQLLQMSLYCLIPVMRWGKAVDPVRWRHPETEAPRSLQPSWGNTAWEEMELSSTKLQQGDPTSFPLFACMDCAGRQRLLSLPYDNHLGEWKVALNTAWVLNCTHLMSNSYMSAAFLL